MIPVTSEPLSGRGRVNPGNGTPEPRKDWIRALLLGLLFVLAGSLILVVQLPPGDETEQLRVGDVAPRNVLAPKRITYASEIETQSARERAEAAVPEIYALPDARIARQQVARARQILDYFDSVRADTYASPDERRELIAAVNDLVLTDGIISRLLTADSETWSVIKAETVSALDQAMRAEIRPGLLATARRRLPTLLDLSVSDEAAAIIIAIVEDLIQPNTFVDEERTTEERKLASESVQPVSITFEESEIILRAGDVVKPSHIEALEALGLQQPASKTPGIVGTAVYLALIGFIAGLYVWRFRPRILGQGRYAWLVFGLGLVFITMIRFMVPGHTLLPYLVPVAALSITLAALVNIHFAILVTTLVGLIVGYAAGGSLELTVYAILGGLAGILGMGRSERVNRLLWAGVYVALTNAVVVLVFRVPTGTLDPIGLLQLLSAGIANGALSASLPLIVFFLVGIVLGITTSLQLHDLARPDQPLLHQLLLRAPGTYHHSLMVSNLAEQAAERIGANTLLTRVGAYYHDVGKMVRPYFFVENQMQGGNVQDRLDPYTSAQIIISHVKDGLELAKKYRLPRDVRAFINEHHGTSVTKYFYRKAIDETAAPSEIDMVDYRYPGPKPQSKETAIVMLADACEAAVRASNPSSVEEIEGIVRDIILDRLSSGELDECDLTMRDLGQIRSAFVEMLQGVFHPRIKYPERVGEEQLALTESAPYSGAKLLPEAPSSTPSVTATEKGSLPQTPG